jgi:hypothetical protein
MIKELVLTCILAVSTPQGEICIKPDGRVEIPADVQIDKVSRDFWEELAKTYQLLNPQKCI